MVWEGVCSGVVSSVHLHSNVDPQVPRIPLRKGQGRRKVSWSSVSGTHCEGFP